MLDVSQALATSIASKGRGTWYLPILGEGGGECGQVELEAARDGVRVKGIALDSEGEEAPPRLCRTADVAAGGKLLARVPVPAAAARSRLLRDLAGARGHQACDVRIPHGDGPLGFYVAAAPPQAPADESCEEELKPPSPGKLDTSCGEVKTPAATLATSNNLSEAELKPSLDQKNTSSGVVADLLGNPGNLSEEEIKPSPGTLNKSSGEDLSEEKRKASLDQKSKSSGVAADLLGNPGESSEPEQKPSLDKPNESNGEAPKTSADPLGNPDIDKEPKPSRGQPDEPVGEVLKPSAHVSATPDNPSGCGSGAGACRKPAKSKACAKALLAVQPSARPLRPVLHAVASVDAVVPIGCDCSCAQALARLGLRVRSFPFDWLRVGSKAGLLRAFSAPDQAFRPGCTVPLRWLRGNEFAADADGQHIFDPAFGLISSHHGAEAPADQFQRRAGRLKKGLAGARRVLFLHVERHPEFPLVVDGRLVPDDGCALSALDAFVDAVREECPLLDACVLSFNATARPQTSRHCVSLSVGWAQDQASTLLSALPSISLTDFEWN
ncbi:hypothetical protein DIPPA_12324 [Diplonema papillatum]|nr:hypothetical protein DIPPA_12324 [Diplonema papillatum]|eukprot:gene22423-34342_t